MEQLKYSNNDALDMHILELFPLRGRNKTFFEEVKDELSSTQAKFLKRILKKSTVGLVHKSLGTSASLGLNISYQRLQPAGTDEQETKKIESINEVFDRVAFEKAKLQFSKDALAKITSTIAPGIICSPAIRKACALQLFSVERFHILLLGDPGIGKTEIIRSSSELHPIHSFGLGSGSSGAGLSLTVQGKQIYPGLLPQANEGICAIDELNLLPEKERGSLYNAMEKGFVTYAKGTVKTTHDAKVRVVATANPKGDKFIGRDVKFLRQQIPFDSALMSRFHLIFIMRLVSKAEFEEITSSIVGQRGQKVSQADIDFVRRYVEETEEIQVDFPKKFEEKIVKWTTQVKEQEDKLLISVSPRLVVGVVRIAQAHARMHLRREVSQADLDAAFDVMEASFKIPVPK